MQVLIYHYSYIRNFGSSTNLTPTVTPYALPDHKH